MQNVPDYLLGGVWKFRDVARGAIVKAHWQKLEKKGILQNET